MRKHKLISLVLVGALSLTSLVGCGKKEEVVQVPIQDLFFENVVGTMNYESFEFETISSSKTLKVEDNSNPLTSSLFEEKEYIEESFYSRGAFDSKNLAFGLNMGMLDNGNKLEFMKLISNSKASYFNMTGLLNNLDKLLESEAFKKATEVASSVQEENENSEEVSMSMSIDVDEMLNDETLMMVELLSKQLGTALGSDYILLDYNELETSMESEIPGENIEKPEENKDDKMKEELAKIPKYMNLLKTTLLLNFKAVDDSYPNTLVNYDANGNYYYLAFTPDLFKDFCKKYVSSLEGNYYTQFPILYKQIMGEDFVATDEMTQEFRDYCDELNKSIDEFDYNFETLVVAFFFSNQSFKVVVETKINEDNSTTNTTIIKNNPELVLNSPSNAKSFETIMEDVETILMGAFMGGFGTEEDDDEGFDEFENTGSNFEIDDFEVDLDMNDIDMNSNFEIDSDFDIIDNFGF